MAQQVLRKLSGKEETLLVAQEAEARVAKGLEKIREERAVRVLGEQGHRMVPSREAYYLEEVVVAIGWREIMEMLRQWLEEVL